MAMSPIFGQGVCIGWDFWGVGLEYEGESSASVVMYACRVQVW